MSEADHPLTDEVDEIPSPYKADELSKALQRSLRGHAPSLAAHLRVLEREIQIGKTRTRLHCYFLPLDGNGRVRFKPLAEFLRDRIVDYSIPRRAIEEAIQESQETGSIAPYAALHERARRLFNHLAKTGEGGELLLFVMAELAFGFAQIICKMTLKTSPEVHYHGSDGVYAEVRDDGGLNLYWGESKIYADPTTAIRDCLASLAPYLAEDEGQDAKRNQDILLVNEFANFTDPHLVEGLRRFLDKNNEASLSVRHCGIALTAFDSASYPAEDAEGTMDAIEAAIRLELPKWSSRIESRLTTEKLDKFDIHFVCVPVPSAEVFRAYFLELLGVGAGAGDDA